MMKWLTILCLFPLVLFGQDTSIYRKLYIFGGESNAGGAVIWNTLTASDSLPKGNVKILNNNNLRFETLQLGVNGNNWYGVNVTAPGNYGWELELANRSTDTIYIVKIAYGGSADTYTSLNWLSTLRPRLDTALKQIRAAGKIPVPYIYWSQGINGGLIDTALYKFNTLLSLRLIRSMVGYAPTFITRLIQAGAGLNPIISRMPDLDDWMYVIDTTGLTAINQHWDKAGIAGQVNRMLKVAADSLWNVYNYFKLKSDRLSYLDKSVLKNITMDKVGGMNLKDGIYMNGSIINYNTFGGNNSVFTIDRYIGIAKKSGSVGSFAVASGQPMKFGHWSTTLLDAASMVSGTLTERMRINTTGNVSIGNTNNTYKLDVSGAINVPGTTGNTYRWNATSGEPINQISPSGWVKIDTPTGEAWIPYYQ